MVIPGGSDLELSPGGRGSSHLHIEVLPLRVGGVFFSKTLGTLCPEERVVVSRVNAS